MQFGFSSKINILSYIYWKLKCFLCDSDCAESQNLSAAYHIAFGQDTASVLMKPSPISSTPALYLHFNHFCLLSNHFSSPTLSLTSPPLCVSPHCLSPAKERVIVNRNGCLVKSARALISSREHRLDRPELWRIGKNYCVTLNGAKSMCQAQKPVHVWSTQQSGVRLPSLQMNSIKQGGRMQQRWRKTLRCMFNCKGELDARIEGSKGKEPQKCDVIGMSRKARSDRSKFTQG